MQSYTECCTRFCELKKDSDEKLLLQDLCIKTLEDNLSFENVFNVLEQAENLNLWNLHEKAKVFIQSNMKILEDNLSIENVCNVLEQAENLNLWNLHEKAKDFIRSNIKTLEDNLSFENVFNVLEQAENLELKSLREKAKVFIRINMELMKDSWENLEKCNPDLFEYVLEIMLKIYPGTDYYTYWFEKICTEKHHIFTKMNLTLEDVFIIVVKYGMHSVNAFIILIAAHRSNAMKIVELARGFINKEKRIMRFHWGHLKFVHNKIFVIAAKIMMGMDIEYHDNDFTNQEVKELNSPSLERVWPQTNAVNGLKKDPYRKLSLQNICIKSLEQSLSCENVFDVLLYAKVLRLWNLRETVKSFIWTNLKSMKESWQNLEKNDPKLFRYALEILLEVYSYDKTKISKHRFQQACTNDHAIYTKMNLSLEGLFMIILENGLNEENALITLMVAHEVNAIKILETTRDFIMRKRKHRNMKYHWGHLLLIHPKIFLTVAKIMMGMNIEYDDNDFNACTKKSQDQEFAELEIGYPHPEHFVLN